MKRSLSVLVLVLALLLCSCTPAVSDEATTEPVTPTQSTAPSTQPTELQATEPTTQSTEPPATEPSTQPTDPTQEPTFVIPDGTPLTDAELAALQTLFQWPSYYAVASNFSFSTPSELSLKQLIREGPDVETRITLTEAEKAQLSAESEGFLHLDTARISKDAVARVLDRYYGLTLEEISDNSSLVYWEETNCFYYCGGGTIACLLTLTQAVVQEDGTIWVRYCDELGMGRIGAMILTPTENGYRILSNQTT